MKTRHILRLTSLLMLASAVVFLTVALSHPEFGTVFYIGSVPIGAAVWRSFYIFYAAVMAVLFGLSFFVKDRK